ncbi:MAG TPA: sigma-70 family RNA polymerase sigma factor [Patescibacteria group bacterium]|nr:sigma-70 family RNA polymerase sigma factor [Patescibacteria group bacterium]
MERVPSPELQRLMERLADGDRSAFHPVFELLWPPLRRFAARHLGPGEADDIAQEALLRVFRRAAEFDPSRSALAWALGIAAYEIRTARRKRQRRREEAAPAGTLATARDQKPTPEETAMQDDMESMLRESLGALRPEDAETLRLYSRGERAHVAAATFRKRVERALTRLRAAWGTDGRR